MKIETRKLENLHVLLWLIKDMSWVAGWHLAGVLMIVPTILVAIFFTWRFRKEKIEFIHNLAICFWISANSIWMIGEFFYNDTTRPWSIALFSMGLATLALYYLPLLFHLSPKKKG
jgi:hypothetical protein